jgi:uracil-DNA glycosylase
VSLNMSDPTRFDLNDRQRAMLAEMGVRVWWPQRPADEQPQVQEQVPAQGLALRLMWPCLLLPAPMGLAPTASPVPRPAASAPKPVVAPMPVTEVLVGKPLAEGVDQMDWAALQATVAACRACDLCANRQQAVFGVGDVHADWLVVGDPQVEAEGQHGEPFVGQAKQLLDNMLKAVGLSREAKRRRGCLHHQQPQVPPSRQP